MRTALLTAYILCCSMGGWAQVVFQKRLTTNSVIDMMPKSIVQCSDSGFLVGAAGYFNGSYLTKTDANGHVEWVSVLSASPSGNSSLIEAGESSTGGYYAFGDNTDTSASATGFYLAVLDNSGNFLWSKIYPHAETEYPHSKIRQTTDGGFVIAQSFMNGMGILRVDQNGNVLWNTIYTGDTLGSLFNPSVDFEIESNGNMVVVGSRDSALCILKIDSTGQILWTSIFSNGTSNYIPETMTLTASGAYVIAGTCDSLPFVMKIDNAGNSVWFHTYNFVGSHYGITEAQNGNLRIVGLYNPGWNTWEELDSNGALVAGRITPGLYHNCSFICSTNDGGFAIADVTFNGFTLHNDLLLLKSNAGDSIRCDYLNFPFGFDASIAPPQAINLPIYMLTGTTTGNTFSYFIQHPVPVDTPACSSVFVEGLQSPLCSANAFPSPVHRGENLSLWTSGVDGNAMIVVYDVAGKAMYSATHQFINGTATTLTIATGDFIPGIYRVCITETDGGAILNTNFVVD